ncbi:MAG: alkaline phosphatase [Tannerella sp.]|jgi:alkaline phosphatase|nr:alkaline phosphatase [Tannerella sp.]
MKKNILLSFLLIISFSVKAADAEQVKPVKNLILMIPDGTSLPTVSIARWYQWYMNPDKPKLAIDPYLCGTVQTHSSNAPIGDSAPTTSCYMTGYPSLPGYVSTYPVSDPANDIYPVDPEKAYQPLITLLEAAKITKQKATGLVFTCEFPHATPADCSAHSYKRGRYDWIAPQMVHNDLDVVMGGGASLLSDTDEAYLKNNGYGIFKNDINGMRTYAGNKMWALYNDREMSYDLDRDPAKEPAIEEMTQIAIGKLAENENGFFLMVEGSKVDWAAHANDPAGMITDFLAFDRACKVALDFARKNGETAVIIVPDHGNSGFSLGVRHCGSYDRLTKDDLFYTISRVKLTAEGFANKLNEEPHTAVQQIFNQYAGFELTEDELNALYHCKSYRNSPIPESERSDKDIPASLYSGSLTGFITKLITAKTCFGFTTGGHTGEEVFLAAFHPQGTLPAGMYTNIELNHYMAALLGVGGQLDSLTHTCFAKHTDVFKDYTCEIVPPEKEKDSPTLIVKNNRKQLTITPNTNIIKSGRKKQEEIRLKSVIVYVDVNNTFYLPQSLVDLIK